MNIKLSGKLAQGEGPKVVVKCPACGHNGTFEKIYANDVLDQQTAYWFGQRRCPNPKCEVHIFFVRKPNGQFFTYPPEVISFDTEGIPNKVLAAFEEAVKCHSTQCFVASAIMIRKTLEEICADRQAQGDNLKKRLKDLGTKIFIPKSLLMGWMN